MTASKTNIKPPPPSRTEFVAEVLKEHGKTVRGAWFIYMMQKKDPSLTESNARVHIHVAAKKGAIIKVKHEGSVSCYGLPEWYDHKTKDFKPNFK